MPEIIKLETNQRRCLGFLPTKDDITGGGHVVFAYLCGDTINTEINVRKKTKNMLALYEIEDRGCRNEDVNLYLVLNENKYKRDLFIIVSWTGDKVLHCWGFLCSDERMRHFKCRI